jgi:hypothetical protein
VVQDRLPGVPVVDKSNGDIVQDLQDGRCNVVAGGLSEVLRAEDVFSSTANYDTISPFGSDVIEPLALVTRQDDAQWSDFVYLVVTATFYAEENGISMSNALTAMPEVHLFGPGYSQMLRYAISRVGSSRDIYERNIQDRFNRTGLNRLYNETFSSPLLYAADDLRASKG